MINIEDIYVLQCNARKSAIVLDSIVSVYESAPRFPDVILISEPPIRLSIRNYKPIRSYRESRTAILVSNVLFSNVVFNARISGDLLCSITLRDITFNCFYLPPSSNDCSSIMKISELTSKFSILAGDCNGFSMLWSSSPYRSHSSQRRNGRLLEDAVTNMDYVCENLGAAPTFSRTGLSGINDAGTSRIDVTFSKGEAYTIENWCVSNLPGIWDHFPITYHVKSIRSNERPVRQDDVHALSSWSFGATDWEHYNKATTELSYATTPITTNDDIQNRYDKLVLDLQNSAKASTKLTTSRKRPSTPLPWWDEEVRNERALLARVMRRGLPEEKKRAKSDYKSLIVKKKQEAYDKFINSLNDVPDKRFYQYIKGKSAEPTRLLEDDKTLNDTLHRLCETYVGSPGEGPRPEACINVNEYIDHQPFVISEIKEVLSARKHCSAKAPGPDGLRWKHLQEAGDPPLQELTDIINASVRCGYVPIGYKQSNTCFLDKAGKDPRKASSLRPITLTSVLSKTTEALLLLRLDPLRKVLYDEGRQCAYLSGRSTIDVHKSVCTWITNNVNWSVISVDYTNAFGELNRERIYSALRKRHVSEAYIRWISLWLDARYTYARYGDEMMKCRCYDKGCPQGSVLSCTLFIITMDDAANDIRSKLNGLKGITYQWICYADDSYLLISWNKRCSPVIRDRLTSCLRIISQVVRLYGLELQESKTQILSNRRHQLDDLIGICDQMKILGIIFTATLSFSVHFRYRASIAMAKSAMVMRFIRATAGLSHDICKSVYIKVLIPIMAYGSEVIGPYLTMTSYKRIVDTVGSAFLRRSYRLRKSTPLNYLYTVSGMDPVSDIILDRVTCYHLHKKPVTKHLPKGRLRDLLWPQLLGERCLMDTTEPLEYEKTTGYPYDDNIMRPHVRIAASRREALDLERHNNDVYKVYTDGSLTKDDRGKKVGCAFIVLKCMNERYSMVANHGVRLSPTTTIMQAELYAIFLALKWCRTNVDSGGTVTLFSDSASGLTLLSSPRRTQLTLAIAEIFAICRTNATRIELSWVPGHSECQGNHIVDHLANVSRGNVNIVSLPVPLCETLDCLDDARRRRLLQRVNMLSDQVLPFFRTESLRSSVSRMLSKGANFKIAQLLCGHTPVLKSYRYHPSYDSNMNCPACDSQDTLSHALLCCPLRAEKRPCWVDPDKSVAQFVARDDLSESMIFFRNIIENS